MTKSSLCTYRLVNHAFPSREGAHSLLCAQTDCGPQSYPQDHAENLCGSHCSEWPSLSQLETSQLPQKGGLDTCGKNERTRVTQRRDISIVFATSRANCVPKALARAVNFLIEDASQCVRER